MSFPQIESKTDGDISYIGDTEGNPVVLITVPEKPPQKTSKRGKRAVTKNSLNVVRREIEGKANSN